MNTDDKVPQVGELAIDPAKEVAGMKRLSDMLELIATSIRIVEDARLETGKAPQTIAELCKPVVLSLTASIEQMKLEVQTSQTFADELMLVINEPNYPRNCLHPTIVKLLEILEGDRLSDYMLADQEASTKH